MVATFEMVAVFSDTIKFFVGFDCRGASISFDVCRCRSLSRTAWSVGVFSGSAPIAFDIHLEDGCMMNEPVDGCQRHGRVGEDCVPFSEGLVGRDEHGSSLVSRADEFEQHAGLGLILGDAGDIVEDQKVEFVELRDGTFEGEVAPRLLQLLNQVGGPGEEHTVAFLDKGKG